MYVDGTSLFILCGLVAAVLAALAMQDRRLARAEPVGRASAEASSRQGTVGFARILVVATWFGLLAGFLHLMLALVNRYLRHRFIMAGPALVWATPVGYGLIFLGLGAAVGLVGRHRIRPGGLIGLFAALAMYSLLLPFVQIHRLAALAVSVGFAAVVSRRMARNFDRWLRPIRATGIAFLATVAVFAVGRSVWTRLARHRAIAALPPASPGAPNILLLVLDTVRAANLSLYGYGRSTTPGLVHWAREGATFDLALSTAPWTLKSHATMFTGLYPSQIAGDFEHPLTIRTPTLAAIFRDRGYLTAGFAANFSYTSSESGLAQGFIDYQDYRDPLAHVLAHTWLAGIPVVQNVLRARPVRLIGRALIDPGLAVDPSEFLSPSLVFGRTTGDEVVTSFLQWQATHPERPFFAFLNFFDGHGPFYAPSGLMAKFDRPNQRGVGRYDASIAFLDQQIDRLLRALRARGVLDNTVVVVTADHGEQFGDHGLTGHANSLYLPLLHVPLLIRFPPQVPPDLRVADAVTLRDLGATMIDLAGLRPAPAFPGRSLAKFWDEGRAGGASPIVSQVEAYIRPQRSWPVWFGAMGAAFDAEFHYIRRGDGHEELFAYGRDPEETVNLAATLPEALLRLRAAISQVVGSRW